VGAFLAIPIATYNFIVWFENPENKWEQAYLKSLIGGISLTVLSIIFFVLSFTRQDRTIVLCNT
jgi:hypothetical protein